MLTETIGIDPRAGSSGQFKRNTTFEVTFHGPELDVERQAWQGFRPKLIPSWNPNPNPYRTHQNPGRPTDDQRAML